MGGGVFYWFGRGFGGWRKVVFGWGWGGGVEGLVGGFARSFFMEFFFVASGCCVFRF